MGEGERPLSGLTVIEFTHMVMGPAVGAILAELGARVIRVEPPGGDPTRRLGGSGAGYFPMYNRGKASIVIDLKAPAGVALARRLIASADILIENFRPGAMAGLGLDYATLAETNPRLIYCSQKGFLPGPYAHRAALDEVAQMMGGLAYMTGPPGRPLRAGASVIDVTGGMFGVIGILAAVEQRHRTGRGQQVDSALFETTVYLVGQHMAQGAVTGVAAAPMPVRVSAWAIYDIFETRDGLQLFVGVVSDPQWERFCAAFGVAPDPALRTNTQRVASRETLLPMVRALFAELSQAELVARLDATGLPFAPIIRPDELFDDPHLAASGGLASVQLPDGRETALPVLPIAMAGQRLGSAAMLPEAGADTGAVLATLGLEAEEIEALIRAGVVAR